MGKKHTIEFVREKFEKDGYECTSKEYIKSCYKLDYICPKGHHGSITWDNWKQGKRCPTCVGLKKLTIGFVRSEFEREGWVCLSNKYINAHSKLNYICSNGHKGSITWNNWQQGKRCPVCVGVKKHTTEFIRSEFEKEDWKLISEKYINNIALLDCICSKGHVGTITWANWTQGIRCPVCAGNKKHTIEFIKSEFEKKGWTLVSKEYINAYSKLEYVCPNGHHGVITWGSWQQGTDCSICAIVNRTGPGHPNWLGGVSCEPYCQIWGDKEYKESIKERDDYKCLNPYCNSKNPNDLNIHHINYNKKLCGPENLITICRSCNTAANKDREWHEFWYKAILNKRYNGTKTLKSVKRRYKIF